MPRYYFFVLYFQGMKLQLQTKSDVKFQWRQRNEISIRKTKHKTRENNGNYRHVEMKNLTRKEKTIRARMSCYLHSLDNIRILFLADVEGTFSKQFILCLDKIKRMNKIVLNSLMVHWSFFDSVQNSFVCWKGRELVSCTAVIIFFWDFQQ